MPADSGKFVLRIAPSLHAELKRLAAAADLSLNEFCARRLAGVMVAMPADELHEVVRQARDLHGDELLGLILYGSWIQGTATRTSDVDLLVVLRPGTAIRRQLYRAWDEVSLTVAGHVVEPAIVALPSADATVSGFWAEIATQGLLLWWADLSVHGYLTKVREEIACGNLRRERSHGQAYWVHKTEVA